MSVTASVAPDRDTLRASALAALAERDPARKCAMVAAIGEDLPIGGPVAASDGVVPGRPDRPILVAPSQLAPRPIGTAPGRAALVHSLAHIEFNAVGLALDIAWRFDGLPDAFYRDWIGVAREEARHYTLLAAHLAGLGHAYGDFPAHDGLWEMARRTGDDLAARLALVPRMLEARGLDVSPAIRRRLISVGDHAGAAILDVILRDEIGHVAIGNRWYREVCAMRGLDPVSAAAGFARQFGAPPPRGPFNLAARRAAGFTDEEIAGLQAAASRVSRR